MKRSSAGGEGVAVGFWPLEDAPHSCEVVLTVVLVAGAMR